MLYFCLFAMLLNKLCIDEENQSLGTGCPDPSLLYSHMYLFWKTVGEQQRFGNAYFFFFSFILTIQTRKCFCWLTVSICFSTVINQCFAMWGLPQNFGRAPKIARKIRKYAEKKSSNYSIISFITICTESYSM